MVKRKWSGQVANRKRTRTMSTTGQAVAASLGPIVEAVVSRLKNARHESSGFTAAASRYNQRKAVVSQPLRTSKSYQNGSGGMYASSGKMPSSMKNKRIYGLPGTFKGKFAQPKKSRKTVIEKYQAKGVVSRREFSAIITDSKCVYVGHSTFVFDEILANFCRSVVKKLLNLHGVYFKAFGETFPEVLRFEILYQNDVNDNSVGTADVPTAAGDSYLTMAIALQAGMFSIWGPAESQANRKKIPVGFRLFAGDVGSATINQLVAELRGNMMLDWYVKSVLKIQNRTRSETGTESDQVDRQPLIGKAYEVSTCGFELDNIVSAATTQSFVASLIDGTITAEAGSFGYPVFDEPPLNSAFLRKVKSVGVRLSPGVIKYSELTTHSSIGLAEFVQKYWGQAGGESIHNHGKSRMYALEKTLSLDPEVIITAGYEVNIETGVSIKMKKVVTNPITSVL